MDNIKDVSYAWLKCAEGQWNYARIVGLFFAIFQIVVIIFIIATKGLGVINNGWQVAFGAIPTAALGFLFAWEVVRGNKRLQIQVGDKKLFIGTESNEKQTA